MTEIQQSRFDGWAIVEVFGHQRYAGYVTTEAYGQAVLFRIEVPPLEARERIAKHYEYDDDEKSIPPGSTVKEAPVQGYRKLFGAGAIYGITPCTKEAAEHAIDGMARRKLTLVSLPPERAIPAPAEPWPEAWPRCADGDDHDHDEDDDPDEDEDSNDDEDDEEDGDTVEPTGEEERHVDDLDRQGRID